MPDTTGVPRPKMSRVAALFTTLELIGASLLVGGLVAAGAIGAVAFSSPDILSHEQAGRFMARVFEGSLFVEATAVFLLFQGSQFGLPALRRSGPLAMILPILFFLPVVGHVTLAHRMTEIRAAHGGTLEQVPKDDPDHREFMKLHGIYEALGLVLLGIGVSSFARIAFRKEAA